MSNLTPLGLHLSRYYALAGWNSVAAEVERMIAAARDADPGAAHEPDAVEREPDDRAEVEF